MTTEATNQDLLDQIFNCSRLPSLPGVALQVIELCRDEHASMPQIADAISNDPALTAKILRTVNSSFYGVNRPITTLSQATMILGLTSVRTLALGFTLLGCCRDLDGGGDEAFDPQIIWRRSIYAAVAARNIASRADLGQEEAFIGGLLQDIGVLALLQVLQHDYIALLDKTQHNHRLLCQVEQDCFQLDHAQVGQALARDWKLPDTLSEPIGHHEQPHNAAAQHRPLATAIHVGSLAADVYLANESEHAIQEFLEAAQTRLHIEPEAARNVLITVAEQADEIAHLFEIKLQPVNDIGQILADANELLGELSMRSVQNAATLEAHNRELQQKLDRDALTSLGNRGRFNTCLRRFFEQARRQTQPLSLILIDADHFKLLNDTHGHVVGDRALVAVSRLLGETAPPHAEVCRYGGEEFAILLPQTPRPEAARVAEALRRHVEQTEIKLRKDDTPDGAPVRMTISLGVATFDGARFFKRAEQLLKAADQAVYAAKAAGRNCVRVFAPAATSPPPAGQKAHASSGSGA